MNDSSESESTPAAAADELSAAAEPSADELSAPSAVLCGSWRLHAADAAAALHTQHPAAPIAAAAAVEDDIRSRRRAHPLPRAKWQDGANDPQRPWQQRLAGGEGQIAKLPATMGRLR